MNENKPRVFDAFRDLVPFLGRIGSRANAGSLAALLGVKPRVRRFPKVSADEYWTFPGAGIEIVLSGGRLRTCFLHVREEKGTGAFTGALDGKLAADAARERMHEAWGLPLKTHEPETEKSDECQNHVIARHPRYDFYERSGCGVSIEYAQGRDARLVRPATITLSREHSPSVLKRSGKSEAARTGGVLSCTFRCARCGKPAETVKLARQAAGPVFYHGFGVNSAGLPEEDAARLEALLLKGDPALLHAFRPRYAASFCPRCGACYCLAHWKGRHGAPPPFGDSWSWDWAEYGTCPYGHERVLREL